MIAACPKCGAKYRVDEAKLGPEGARLRCKKCQAVFRVRAPGTAAPAAAAPAPTVVTALSQEPSSESPPVASDQAPATLAEGTAADETRDVVQYDPERLVLIADPSVEGGKSTASALTEWGLQPLLVHDGVEAMLSIQRALPRAVVLDAALPKMFGFQVCEIVKRNESLKHTTVVLIGAIHNRDRYRRPASDIYGADAYLEQPDLPDALAPILRQAGLPISQGSGSDAGPTAELTPPPTTVEPPQPIPADPPTPAPPPESPAPASDDGLAAEREKAERLARIVVSDIVLYQGEKFDQAIASGNVLEALESEIAEGRNFFMQRIGEEIRSEKDHLVEELLRVAKERGAQ